MEVKKERGIPLAVPVAAAWDLIQDVEAVASCFPGASITERLCDTRFKGGVRLKIGPVTADFTGTVEIDEIDAAGRRIAVAGRGTDSISASRASMELRAVVEDRGDAGCEVVGVSTVSVTGKLATLGGRMMDSVADRLLDRFAASFTEKATARAASAPPGETSPAPVGELNVIALTLGALWDRIKRLFGG